MGDDVRMIDKVTRVINLYDLYCVLLTKRQREIMEMYYFDDWSLAEVAENLGVTRQAVHDNVRRAEDQLESYEKALSLLENTHSVSMIVSELRDAWMQIQDSVPEAGRNRVQGLLNALATELQIAFERGDDHA